MAKALFKKTPAASGEKKKKSLKDFHPFDNNTFLLIFSLLTATVIWFAMMDDQMAGRGSVVTNVPI